jgi:membrane dipeptidase
MQSEHSPSNLDHRAVELLKSALVWDNVWPVDLPGNESAGNDWDKLQRFAKAGVGAIGLTLAGDNHSSGEALRLTGWARKELRSRSSYVALVHNVDDIKAARRAGKLAVVLQFEGTRCFERDLNLIEMFYALGVRQTILAFNNSNCTGAGCAEASDGGLTSYGRRFIAEAERVGMLIDLSHVGRRTSLDALAVATKPMVFSHCSGISTTTCNCWVPITSGSASMLSSMPSRCRVGYARGPTNGPWRAIRHGRDFSTPCPNRSSIWWR